MYIQHHLNCNLYYKYLYKKESDVIADGGDFERIYHRDNPVVGKTDVVYPTPGIDLFIYKKDRIEYKFINYPPEKINNDYFYNFKFILKIDFETIKISNGQEISLVNKAMNDPEIFITSQLLIDKSDIGNTIFNVISKVVNIFEKSCPKIVNVLKGEGETIWDKVNNLYITDHPGVIGLDFLYNIVIYSMLKYILGKLLYGEFEKIFIFLYN